MALQLVTIHESEVLVLESLVQKSDTWISLMVTSEGVTLASTPERNESVSQTCY